jgi:hypothetical protein
MDKVGATNTLNGPKKKKTIIIFKSLEGRSCFSTFIFLEH